MFIVAEYAALNQKTIESKNSSRGQSYLYSMVSNATKHISRFGVVIVNQGLWVRSSASSVCQIRL